MYRDSDYDKIINNLLNENIELRLKNQNLYKRVDNLNNANSYYISQLEKMRKIISLLKTYFPESYSYILHKCNSYWKDIILENDYNDIFYL